MSSREADEPVVCDLEHAEVSEVAAAIEGATAVVFAAGAGAGSGAERKLTMDRDGAIKLLDAAVAAGAKRYVMISSIGAEGASRHRRRVQRLPASEGRGRRSRAGQRSRVDDREARAA